MYRYTEEDERTGKHSVVGYFSKEKYSMEVRDSASSRIQLTQALETARLQPLSLPLDPS